MHTMTWVYTLLFAGFIFLMLPLALNRYKKIFRDCEKIGGRVIKMRNMVSEKYDYLVCPEIEYTLDGKTQKAHHYYGIFKDKADFSVGDDVTVLINPKYPSIFRFESDEAPLENNSVIFMAIIGAVMMVAGLIIWRFFS